MPGPYLHSSNESRDRHQSSQARAQRESGQPEELYYPGVEYVSVLATGSDKRGPHELRRSSTDTAALRKKSKWSSENASKTSTQRNA